tara:strand:- start:3754 stop:4308 length:555 start_codon:yes stop_codon:yes gene_type:complete
MKTSVINKNSGDYGKFNFVVNSKDVAFASGRWQDLVRNGEVTSLVVNDATVDAGITLLANYEYLGAWIGNAASAITLPKADEGTFIVYVNTAAADEANAMVITAASGDTYEAHQEVHIGTGIPAQQDVSVAADSVLTITCAATNGGWGQIGSNFMFYCKNEGEWLVDVNGVSEGTGATATIAFS